MARRRQPRRQLPASPPARAAFSFDPLTGRRWPLLLAALILVFYWTPLTSPSATIQWDAVDTHYSPQKYFADRVHRFELPFWTPYVFSGFPFLADPQVGAFYPLNWPFFLLGITPRAIQWELALHAWLACAGAFLLLRRLVENRVAALLGACAYGLSGFFAGHSSHVGIFQGASLLPWLLLWLHRALESSFLRFAALGGLTGAMIVLAGHFQTALYAFAALGLFAAAELLHRPKAWRRVAGFVLLVVALAGVLSAIQTLPGLELTAASIRAGADFGASREGILELRALLGLVWPDALGILSGSYRGPADITQYCFYAGVLLLPLAALGLRDAGVRLRALLLIVPAAWYMLGPAAGLYRLGAWLPGFHQVRSPVNGWFVAALGLAVLAAAGARWALERWRWRYLGLLVSAAFALDLACFNCWTNPLAYARASFEDLYGNGLELTRTTIASRVPPLTRFQAPERLTALGPLNHPLELGLEATYGYNPLKLAAYDEYMQAMSANPKLRDGLNVSRRLDLSTRTLAENPACLPRAYVPRKVLAAADAAEARRLLHTLDPARQVIVTRPHPPIRQDPEAMATLVGHGEQGYRLRTRAASPTLVRLSVPFFPGWSATAAARHCPVVRADHALLGVVVPAGEHEVVIGFRSRRFAPGAALSVLGLLTATAFAWLGRSARHHPVA